MESTHLKVSRVIEASAEAVYRVLADYRTEHPQILPRPPFTSLVVEKGGTGAGTVIRVGMKVMGTTRTMVMTVTEPEPGRVLQEEDLASGVRTTFTVIPLDGSTRCEVTIATVWQPKPGLQGLIERWLNPAIARPLYKKELALIAGHMRSKG